MNEESKTPTVRAAIYLHSTGDHSKPNSLEEQEWKCRSAAASQAPPWSIADEQVFVDTEVSGLSIHRPGLKLLLQKAAEYNRPFDVVVSQNTRTLDPSFSVVLDIVEGLGRSGVSVYFVDEMLDTRDDFFTSMAGLTRRWCLPQPQAL